MRQEDFTKLCSDMAQAIGQALHFSDGCEAVIPLPEKGCKGVVEIHSLGGGDRWSFSLSAEIPGAFTTRYYARGTREAIRQCCLSKTSEQWANELLSVLRKVQQMYYP